MAVKRHVVSSQSAQPIIEVAGGVVVRDGQFLIAQRKADDRFGLLWEFPGGKRKPSETFEECLRRELAEELGVEVLVGPKLTTVVHHYERRTLHLHIFFCRLVAGKPKPLECAAVRWVSLEAMLTHPFPPANRRILEALVDQVQRKGVPSF